jgi:MFS family permease
MSTAAATAVPSDATRYAWARVAASLALLAVGSSGMYMVIVALKPVALEFGVSRSAASLPYALTMVGFGLGGILMGRLSDRVGAMGPLLAGTLSLSAGFFAASRADSLLGFCLAQGVLVGLLGISTTFAPLVADITHWFERQRGMAVAIVISGTYVGGVLWPPLVQHLFDTVGWRQAYLEMAVLCLGLMLPLCLVLHRRAPRHEAGRTLATTPGDERPLGLSRGMLQCLLCGAGVGCCAAMAMPQAHIVAFVSDLGHPAARGAEMLALMLGFGVVSRLGSGWISDRIGGLRTLLVGSTLQALTLALFIPSHSLQALYVVSILFGLSQGGIVPSYTMIVRAFFPAGDAGWRIGTVLLFTVFGMALGAWLAGALYDLTGSYTAAFVNALAFNVVNMAIAGFLLRRAPS